MNDGSMLIAKNLNLDMAWLCNITFDINSAVTKCADSFGLRHLHIYFKIFFFCHDAHSASAAAGNCLDDDGKADRLCNIHRFIKRFDNAVSTRHNRHACFFHRLFGTGFITHRLDHLRSRTDKSKSRCSANICELSILR